MAFQSFEYHSLLQFEDSVDSTYTPGTNRTILGSTHPASKIDSLWATNSDTVALIAQLTDTSFSPTVVLQSVSIPAGSGTDGTHPPIDLLANLPTGQQGLVLAVNSQVLWALTTAPGSGKVVSLYGCGGEF